VESRQDHAPLDAVLPPGSGRTLAGLAVAPGNTAVISEEPQEIWADRAARCNFGGNVCFFSQPFLGLPSLADWQALIDRVLAEHQARGLSLVAIDPLGPFLRAENNTQAILEALLPLTALTRAGMAVLLIHHPSKGAPPLGQAARGSGALLGHVDTRSCQWRRRTAWTRSRK
jgi:AAA domain